MLRRVFPLARWGAVLFLLAAHAGAEPADEVTRDAARSLGLSGIEAYQAGSYDTASNRLEKAYALMNVPSLGLWSARALAKRNLLVEAANRYIEVVSLQVPEGDAAVQRQAQLDAQADLEQLRPQIPRLTIAIDGADASDVRLSIDGQPAPASIVGKPRLVNPGVHRVDAQVGGVSKSASVALQPGKEASVVLSFVAPAPAQGPLRSPLSEPLPRSEPRAASTSSTASGTTGRGRRTLGWVGVGVGGAGLALGAALGGLALDKRASLKNSGACSDAVCPPEKRGDVERLNTYRTVSTVGFIAGGALAATGIVLLLTAPSDAQQLAVALSPGTVALAGRF